MGNNAGGGPQGGYTPQTQGWGGVGGMSTNAQALPPQAQGNQSWLGGMPSQAQGVPQGGPPQGMPPQAQGVPMQGMPPQAQGNPQAAPPTQSMAPQGGNPMDGYSGPAKPMRQRDYLQGMVPQEFYKPQSNFQETQFRTPEELMNKDAMQSWRSSMYPGGEKPRGGGRSNDPFWKMREQATQMRRSDQDAYRDARSAYRDELPDGRGGRG
jgi:hypothetical protein